MTEKDELARLRAQYEAIKPPAGFAERLDGAMRRTRRVSPVRWLRRVGGTAVAAMLVLTIAVNASASAAETLGKLPVVGALTRLVTFRDFTDVQENMEAAIRTPHVEGLDDEALQNALNARFDDYADELIAQYRADLAAEGGPESIDAGYRVVRDDERLLVVRISATVTRASAQQIERYYTVDKQSGRLLRLSDLFREGSGYADALSQNVLEQIAQRMADDPAQEYFTGDDPGAFTRIGDAQQFYIDAQGRLVLSFDEYDIAPGAMGAVTFTIPQEVTRELRAQDAPLA